MEPKKNEFVLNPKTNRYIKKGTARHIRLLKEGVLDENSSYKPPALVVEKKVKAVANVEDLSKTELDDIFSQIKLLREKRDSIINRRLRGRPEGVKGDPNRPKVKEELKPKIKEESKKPSTLRSKFNISVQPSSKASGTEYDFEEEDD